MVLADRASSGCMPPPAWTGRVGGSSCVAFSGSLPAGYSSTAYIVLQLIVPMNHLQRYRVIAPHDRSVPAGRHSCREM